MDTRSTFETLTSELSTQERQQILASIRKSMEGQAAPIAGESEPESPEIEIQLKTLGLLERIRLFFAQIFTGRTREEVVQGWIMRSLRDRLARLHIDGIDGKTGQFRETFAADLEQLQREASVLSSYVDAAARRRTELVFALAIHNFPGIHRELMTKTGAAYLRSLKEESERFLKRKLSSSVDDLLNDIPSTSRAGMKNALDQADVLYRLAGFSYQGLLGSFEGVGMDTGRHCAFDYVLRVLESLQNILSCLNGPLDLALLETLVILNTETVGDHSDENEFQEAVRNGLSRITEALATFRRFSAAYPLTLIIRVVKEDPWWTPWEEHGGEDWVALYRGFFGERIQRIVLTVSLQKQVRKQLDSIRDVASMAPHGIIGLPDGRADVCSTLLYQGMVVKTFMETIWPRVVPHLKIVLTGGEFYKSSNRAQFNDAYSEFELVPGKLAEIEEKLTPEGTWGHLLQATEDLKQRRAFAARIDDELRPVVDLIRVTVEMFVNLLGGILYARPGSSYDTLANYGQIGGRRNAELIDELKDTHAVLQLVLTALGDLSAIESRAKENGIRIDLLDDMEQPPTD